MTMQPLTFTIWTASNTTPDTDPAPPCHVLIRTPLSESTTRAPRTVTFDTHARAARAQAADADAVAVHARDVLDAHPRAAAADADAVVAVADPGVEDPDGARVLDVDAVGVRARRRRADDEAVDQHPAAPVELEVELRAVLHPQALHAHVAARHELDQLHSTTYLTLSRINTRLINLNN